MGFKELTPNNWDRPDDTSSLFVRVSPVAGVVSMNGNDWARAFLAVELAAAVPPDIRDLFAVARGTLVYGWFFYPLYALGEEQLHRVADAAVAHRYRELHGPRDKRGYLPSLAKRVQWLLDKDVIAADTAPRWSAIRDLRNIGSHPDFQMLHPPGDVLTSLETVAATVTALFVAHET
jgi:hypothetical protein